MFRRRYAHVDEPGARRPVVVSDGAGAFAGRSAVASLITTIAALVAGIIVLGILLVVLDANPANGIVEAVTDAAKWLAGPFRDLFQLQSDHWQVVVNWGLAAVVYVALARLIARLIMR